ncbi:sialate O-acetylesterase [Planctomicrobium sp. SH668]|uniref:sialate O-acetylesterase n=1 Tax=Planctomicrobium sp. SH668 TaxID=3448126 RepID=UPI003F5C9348
MNKLHLITSTLFIWGMCQPALHSAEIVITSPTDYQVVQRDRTNTEVLQITGELRDLPHDVTIECRLQDTSKQGDWEALRIERQGNLVTAQLIAPAGGWYQLHARVRSEDQIVAECMVPHVGVGEIFVVAGQSNSANHGEERLTPASDRVVSFSGNQWQIAADPQPGASGSDGSFIPALGDKLLQEFNVPIGFVACGIGATSVREWLPAGTTFPHPPTLLSNVRRLETEEWESLGGPYNMFIARMKSLGQNGFRAVLWHQGESDANQSNPLNTLSGPLYRKYLEQLIVDSRKEIGWEAPWIVAQVSYHVPGDESDPAIREAQASLWKDRIAIEGPDSDQLKREFRDNGGNGVHFSAGGLKKLADCWKEKITPWLHGQLK